MKSAGLTQRNGSGADVQVSAIQSSIQLSPFKMTECSSSSSNSSNGVKYCVSTSGIGPRAEPGGTPQPADGPPTAPAKGQLILLMSNMSVIAGLRFLLTVETWYLIQGDVKLKRN